MPKVSVIIPSYNHEKYIAGAIHSVLAQSYQDFEIVITDDGSSDNSIAEIRKFEDSRISLFVFKENKGACVAMNNCIRNATGEYIAVLNSDDAFLPTKLEKQVKFLDEHPQIKAVFGYAHIIDENGDDFTDDRHFYYNIFKQPNRTRFEWLNHFFYKGNCLCHPSALIRRKCYEDIGYYDPRLSQLPDFDFWIRICMKYEIHVMPEELINFRIRKNNANISAQGTNTLARYNFEHLQVLKNFLKIKTHEEFLKTFPDALVSVGDRDYAIPYNLALIALKIGAFGTVHQFFAINVLFEILGNGDSAARLEGEFGFKYMDLIKLAAESDIFNFKKLAEQDQEIAEKNRILNEMLNSYSWKITKPLRELYSKYPWLLRFKK